MTSTLRGFLVLWGLAVSSATLSSVPVVPCVAMDARLISAPEEGGPALLLHGEIFLGDTDRIVPKLLRMYQRGGTPRLILDSGGGNLIDAEKLALLIHRAGIPVAVMAGRMCASACFLLFAASPDKSASTEALIGVHSASLFGDENLATLPITMLMAREASNFGVPPDVIGRMVTTKPSDMAWLTAEELKKMDVRLIETPPASPAGEQSAALSRSEEVSSPQSAISRSEEPPQPPSPTPTPSPAIIAPPRQEVAGPLAYRPADLASGLRPAEVAAVPWAPVNVRFHDSTSPIYLPVGFSTAVPLTYRPGA